MTEPAFRWLTAPPDDLPPDMPCPGCRPARPACALGCPTCGGKGTVSRTFDVYVDAPPKAGLSPHPTVRDALRRIFAGWRTAMRPVAEAYLAAGLADNDPQAKAGFVKLARPDTPPDRGELT